MGQDQSGAVTVSRCPWCSSELAAPGSTTCPTCGAALVEPDGSVPGVNAVDAEAISRAARTTTPIRRSRLLSWITGEDDYEDEAPAPPGSLAPPPPDVRREMLRLELAAEYANLQAEADAVVAGAQADARDASRRAEAPATEREAPTAEASGSAEPPAVDDPESPDRPD